MTPKMKKFLTWLSAIGSALLVWLTLGNIDLLKKPKQNNPKEKVKENEVKIKKNEEQAKLIDIQVNTLKIEKEVYIDLLNKQKAKLNSSTNREIELEEKNQSIDVKINDIKSQLGRK